MEEQRKKTWQKKKDMEKRKRKNSCNKAVVKIKKDAINGGRKNFKVPRKKRKKYQKMKDKGNSFFIFFPFFYRRMQKEKEE